MRKILSCLMVAYLSVAIGVYVAQRHLQYHPDDHYPGKPAANHVPEMKEMHVATADGLDLLAWFVPPKKKNGRVIVFYHGNAGNIADRAYKMRYFINKGYGVYMCEYRGFGGNGGSISEQGLYNDARSALTWLTAHGYPVSQWVIYGESIGTGPAVEMAMEYQPRTLILEGAFSSAVDVGEKRYPWLPVNYMMKDRYDNTSKIKSIHAALFMMHGSNDPVIDPAFARKLFDAANEPKKLVIVKGAVHNNMYDFNGGNIILDWLEKQP